MAFGCEARAMTGRVTATLFELTGINDRFTIED